MKTGKTTSEFMLTIVVTILGTLLSAFGAWKGSDVLSAMGGMLVAGQNGAYTVSRGLAKKGAQPVSDPTKATP